MTRNKSTHMLFARTNSTEIKERAIVMAFDGGWATNDHFDEMADMVNVLYVAATSKQDDDMINICRGMVVAMENIRDNKNNATEEECKMLSYFVDAYRDFWMRQTVGFYDNCCKRI